MDSTSPDLADDVRFVYFLYRVGEVVQPFEIVLDQVAIKEAAGRIARLVVRASRSASRRIAVQTVAT